MSNRWEGQIQWERNLKISSTDKSFQLPLNSCGEWCNSADSSILKWTPRSLLSPTGASLALSRWPPVFFAFIQLHFSQKESAHRIQPLELWRWGTAPGCCSCGWRLSTLSPVLEARTTLSGTFLSLFSFDVDVCTSRVSLTVRIFSWGTK